MAMNPIVRAQLNEFKKANPSEQSDDSELFEVMSIFSVENGILGENIDPFQSHLKGKEFGIDGISIIIQGTLCTDEDEASSVLSVGKNHSAAFHLFQSKTSDKLDYGEISKFLDATYDFFTDLELLSGPQIEDLAAVRDMVFAAATKSNPELRCYFCTTGTGEVSDAISKLIDSHRSRLESLNVFETVEIKCLGARDIQEGFRSATNSTSATVNFPKAITMPAHENVEEAYIGYVAADQILRMAYSDPDPTGDRHINRTIFYDNVRDFDPSSEINQSIIRDLQSGDLSSFVFKNNGITVVAKTVTRKGDNFTVDDFQIVNGCQTTNILSLFSDQSSDIMVPIRIIGSSNTDFVSSIIIGTNKQNEVRDDQFWALLPFMKDLEVFCAAQDGESKIFIERRDNQYREVSVERTRIMRPSDLMKVAAAMFFFQPHRAARDHRGIRKEFSNRIFIDNHSVELYHMAALALYKFDFLVRTGRVDRSWSIYKFYALYALVRAHWQTPDLLDAQKRRQEKVRGKVLDTILNNDNLILHIEAVSKKIDTMIASSGAKTREQIRDYIRTESFADAFSEDFFENGNHVKPA